MSDTQDPDRERCGAPLNDGGTCDRAPTFHDDRCAEHTTVETERMTDSSVHVGTLDNTYTCDYCDRTFAPGDYKHPRQAYAGHFNSPDHPNLLEAESAAANMPAYLRIARRLRALVPALSGIELPDAPQESGTERDGVFSYAVEVHAFFFGVGFGVWLAVDFVQAVNVLVALMGAIFVSGEARKVSKRLPTYITEQAAQEWHYFNGGLVGGVLLAEGLSALNSAGIETDIPDWLGLVGVL